MAHAAREALLAWYDAHGRTLPWRGVDDPYAVWVSEVMLQQTRVDVVQRRFAAWMARFSTIDALAAAREEEVLAMWNGLGYYRRARTLWRGAGHVVANHGGRLPADVAALREVPGIGAYTAAAIASIAHGIPVAAVDGNVLRVMARFAALEAPIDRPQGHRAAAQTAAALLDQGRPGDWNQAVMDLGATVCKPVAPACASCPLAPWCAARRDGRTTGPDALPRRSGRKAPRVEAMVFARIRDGHRILVVQEPGEGLLGGMWRLPGGPATEPVETIVQAQAGITPRMAPGTATARHAFTHRVWEMAVHDGVAVGAGPLAPGARWVALEELEGIPFSTAARKALEAQRL